MRLDCDGFELDEATYQQHVAEGDRLLEIQRRYDAKAAEVLADGRWGPDLAGHLEIMRRLRIDEIATAFGARG